MDDEEGSVISRRRYFAFVSMSSTTMTISDDS